MRREMVKLTGASFIKSEKDDSKSYGISKSEQQKKNTHLYLHDKFLKFIGNISKYRKLTVLYLHNNDITKIENLETATNLTHLYLQRNKISKIENLGNLNKLRKLYLGNNCISVVEGLESLSSLEELHVERQHLPEGETLYFHPQSIEALSSTLKVLNVSGNGLNSLLDLAPLRKLTFLSAKDNRLLDVGDITNVVSGWFILSSLELQGNPVCKCHHYRENIIAAANRIALLDGKFVPETTRVFVKHLMKNTAYYQRLEREGAVQKSGDVEALTAAANIAHLTNAVSPYVMKSVSRSILRDVMPGGDSLSGHSGLDTFFPPWPSGNVRRGNTLSRSSLYQTKLQSEDKSGGKELPEDINFSKL
ncbi:protein phosphatase 1 regulatory subunit 42-like [Schistocerca nitens]|uniref:protein phosphatase 1 regulatory subunit 42-like n=1 Tax=Schistocerca nitens TaxID=7011 RepID=UPI00211905B9|nr:protein phosphatase 1 regulatory subunit 42-like [Schistocerca nitens]